MIVNMNSNNSDSYLTLFTDAYRFLKAIDEKEGTSYVDPNKERFASLAEYYGHMADLFDTFAYQYIMVPLDEEPFKIELNKREIVVPESFKKCASIQTDLLAETIIFTADRYFDYMDLATTEIYVQWITPDNIQGATRVEMIDRTQGDILKFAWPLNNIITKTPGDVKFSVRFFRLDAESDEVVYSLNTQDNKITILPALQPEGPSIVEKPIGDNSFKRAIVNSYYSAEGIPEPETPSYRAPGSDITVNPENLEILMEDDNNIINGDKVVGLKENTVTLYAQAIVPDAGEIRYEWYYKPNGSEVAYPCAAFPVEGGDPIVFGTVADAYIEVKDDDKKVRVPHERYYTEKDGAYSLYTGAFPTEETLYTKFSAYTVAEDDAEITGKYHVRAYNEIQKPNSTEIISSTRYAASIDCLLPAPNKVVITTDLEDGAILVDGKAELKMEVAADEYGPAVNYEWRMSDTSATDVLDTETAAVMTTTEAAFTATAPGWYSGRVVSVLNRKEEDEFSSVCKVTNKPLPPRVSYQGNEEFGEVQNKDEVLSIQASVAEVGDLPADLLSDKLNYVWQIRPIDSMSNSSNWITITDSIQGIRGQGTAELTVTKDMPYGGANFRCLVINELNGAKAVFDHSGTYANNIDPTLGEFKNEAPYVFADGKSFVYTVVNMK